LYAENLFVIVAPLDRHNQLEVVWF